MVIRLTESKVRNEASGGGSTGPGTAEIVASFMSASGMWAVKCQVLPSSLRAVVRIRELDPGMSVLFVYLRLRYSEVSSDERELAVTRFITTATTTSPLSPHQSTCVCGLSGVKGIGTAPGKEGGRNTETWVTARLWRRRTTTTNEAMDVYFVLILLDRAEDHAYC